MNSRRFCNPQEWLRPSRDLDEADFYICGQSGRGERLAGAESTFTYAASVPTTRPAADYTPRLVPEHVGALVPLETPLILWHGAPSWR